MNSMFIELVNISIMASWLVLVILSVRLLFKKIPKWVICILWILVGLRLILPISIESTLSLLPSSNTIDMTISQARPTIQTGIEGFDQNVNEYISSNYFEGVTVKEGTFSQLISNYSIIWIVGIVFMIIYAYYSYYKIHNQVQVSILYKDNIYLCDDIDTPFILGVFNPKIYLPSFLDEKQVSYVLKHEQAHIARKDHFIKPIGFILLSIYWFNPILWIAYVCLCKDIEAACDEKVIKDMNTIDKKEYSETLFDCSVQRNMIMACPLAFGEIGVKERIKSIVDYKKPSFWVIILSIILCICISIGFLTVPKNHQIVDINEPTAHITLLDNVSDIVFTNKNVEVSHESEVNELVNLLLKVEIKNKEISLDRSEDRDKTNQIELIYNNNLDRITTINFNNDYSEVWLDDGVKPTLSYQVNNPSFVKQIFTSYQSKENTKVSESFNAQVIGIENEYIAVQPYDNEKEAEKSNVYYIDYNIIVESLKFKLNIGSQINITYDGNIYENEKVIPNVYEIQLLNIIKNPNYDSNEDSFIFSSIKEKVQLKQQAEWCSISYKILGTSGNIAFNTNYGKFNEYLVVLYKTYNYINDEVVYVEEFFQPMVISYQLSKDGNYTLKSVHTSVVDSTIESMFPNPWKENALNYVQYYDELSEHNLEQVNDNVEHFIKPHPSIAFEELMNKFSKFDNGYTDEDYQNASGEDCMHPRVSYELSEFGITIGISSDPHRLFCYYVTVMDWGRMYTQSFFMNSEDYENIQKVIEEYNHIKTYP